MKQSLILLCAAALLAGCQAFRAEGPQAAAELQPTKGNAAKGTATFTQVGDKVRVHAVVTGLKPGSSARRSRPG